MPDREGSETSWRIVRGRASVRPDPHATAEARRRLLRAVSAARREHRLATATGQHERAARAEAQLQALADALGGALPAEWAGTDASDL